MPFKPGQSGNPGGGVKEKRFLGALERAIAQDDGKKLRAAAEKLLDLAAEGESWAIAQLADRLDGKASQQIDMNIRRSAPELDDDELRSIASRGRDGAAEEKVSPSEPGTLH